MTRANPLAAAAVLTLTLAASCGDHTVDGPAASVDAAVDSPADSGADARVCSRGTVQKDLIGPRCDEEGAQPCSNERPFCVFLEAFEDDPDLGHSAYCASTECPITCACGCVTTDGIPAQSACVE